MILRGVATAIAAVAATAALLLSLAPWAGDWIAAADIAAAALPIAPVLAVLAIGFAWRRSVIVPAIAVIALGIATATFAYEWRDAPKVSTPGRGLVIITHNIAVRNADPAGTIATLAASDADILILQETEGTVRPYLGQLRRSFPYASECRKPCSLAIFSRIPLTRVRYRFRDETGKPFGPGLVQTRVKLPGVTGGFVLASVHLSRRLPLEGQSEARRALAEAAARVGTRSLVVAGDFNLVPWSAAMRDFDAAVAPMRRVTRGLFSFPADFSGHAVPVPVLPIDHLFAGPDWGVRAVRRLPRTGSDHYPLRIELVWQGPDHCVTQDCR